MHRRKFPLLRRMEEAKNESQQKRIERTPVSVDDLVQAKSRRGPPDLNIRNSIRGHFIAARPRLQQSQNQDHAPQEEPKVRLGRRNCRRKWILLFRLRASQMMHSSSAAKIQPKLARRLCQDSDSLRQFKQGEQSCARIAVTPFAPQMCLRRRFSEVSVRSQSQATAFCQLPTPANTPRISAPSKVRSADDLPAGTPCSSAARLHSCTFSPAAASTTCIPANCSAPICKCRGHCFLFPAGIRFSPGTAAPFPSQRNTGAAERPRRKDAARPRSDNSAQEIRTARPS